MLRKLSVVLGTAFVCLVLLMPASWAGSSFTWPVSGEVITKFSQGAHRGIDICANAGGAIVAAQDGVVYWIGRTPRGEPCISVDHPNGLTTTYLPVEAAVREGQTVSAGETLGTLTADGDVSSETPHLHFGLFETATRDNKKYIDPSSYLPGSDTHVEPQAEDLAVAKEQVDTAGTGQASIPQETQPVATIPEADNVPVAVESPGKVAIAPASHEAPAPNNPVQYPLQSNSSQGSVEGDNDPAGAALGEPGQSVIPAATAVGKSDESATRVPLSPGAPAIPYTSTEALSHSQRGGTVPANMHGVIKGSLATSPSALYAIAPAKGIEPVGSNSAGPGKAPALPTGVLPAYTASPGANPFYGKPTMDSSANVTGKKQPALNATPYQARDVSTGGTLGWKFLPDLIVALLIAMMGALSVQSMRKARRAGFAMALQPGH